MRRREKKLEHDGHAGRLSRFVEPKLLLFLLGHESYGYELIERLNDLPVPVGPPIDPGAVYRALRRMEAEELVCSEWETGRSGPARRIYRIMPEGEDRLAGWVVHMRKRKEAIEKFLEIYGRRGEE